MSRLFLVAAWMLLASTTLAEGMASYRQDGPRKAIAKVVNWAEGYRRGVFYTGSGTLTEVHGREGVVLTAAHVFEDRKGTITVEFCDGQISGARLLAIDEKLDVAALVIFAPRGIKPVALAKSEPELGKKVDICGYGPKRFRAFPALVARPILLSGDEPETMIGARGVDKGEVTIPGDSGGPMICDGKLVGVHWGYRGAASDPRRCVHALGCRSLEGWVRGNLTRWSPRPSDAQVVSGSKVATGTKIASDSNVASNGG